jgi:rSAM-associated Gly-rich repeat protein
MPISNHTSFVGFLVALSALSVPGVAMATSPDSAPPAAVGSPATLEDRLSRLSAALQSRAEQLPAESRPSTGNLIAGGFANGSGGGGWVNGNRGGWADGNGGGFVNRNAWGNGWGDGGGFANWRNY